MAELFVRPVLDTRPRQGGGVSEAVLAAQVRRTGHTAAARAASGLFLATGGTLVAAGLTPPLLATLHTRVWRVDDVVGAALLGAGLAIACWYALTGVAILLSALLRTPLGVQRWGAPFARRLAIGLMVSAGVGAPAMATPAWESLPAASQTDPSPLPSPLDDWEPDRPESESPPATSASDARPAEPAPPDTPEPGATAPHAATPASGGQERPGDAPTGGTGTASPVTSTPSAESGAAAHEVRAGECLWSIAETRLPDDASDARIAVFVHGVVALNPGALIDPDLIHPGQVLTIPEVQP